MDKYRATVCVMMVPSIWPTHLDKSNWAMKCLKRPVGLSQPNYHSTRLHSP